MSPMQAYLKQWHRIDMGLFQKSREQRYATLMEIETIYEADRAFFRKAVIGILILNTLGNFLIFKLLTKIMGG